MNLSINKYEILPSFFTLGTAGSYGVETLDLNFSEDWDGLTKVVSFLAPGASQSEAAVIVLGDETTINVPSEFTTTAGLGNIVFQGVKDGVNLISVTAIAQIVETTAPAVTPEGSPTPSEMEQVLAYLGEARNIAQSVRDDADAGEFDGVSVTGAEINDEGHLIITLSNEQVIDAGYAVGEQGVSVTDVKVNGLAHVIVTLSNGETIDAGELIPMLMHIRDVTDGTSAMTDTRPIVLSDSTGEGSRALQRDPRFNYNPTNQVLSVPNASVSDTASLPNKIYRYDGEWVVGTMGNLIPGFDSSKIVPESGPYTINLGDYIVDTVGHLAKVVMAANGVVMGVSYIGSLPELGNSAVDQALVEKTTVFGGSLYVDDCVADTDATMSITVPLTFPATITRYTGKNIFRFGVDVASGTFDDGLTYSAINANESMITLNGTTTAARTIDKSLLGSFLLPAGTYTLSSSHSGVRIWLYRGSTRVANTATSTSFTLTQSAIIAPQIQILSGHTFDRQPVVFQIEHGSTATMFESYNTSAIEDYNFSTADDTVVFPAINPMYLWSTNIMVASVAYKALPTAIYEELKDGNAATVTTDTASSGTLPVLLGSGSGSGTEVKTSSDVTVNPSTGVLTAPNLTIEGWARLPNKMLRYNGVFPGYGGTVSEPTNVFIMGLLIGIPDYSLIVAERSSASDSSATYTPQIGDYIIDTAGHVAQYGMGWMYVGTIELAPFVITVTATSATTGTADKTADEIVAAVSAGKTLRVIGVMGDRKYTFQNIVISEKEGLVSAAAYGVMEPGGIFTDMFMPWGSGTYNSWELATYQLTPYTG